MISGRTVYYDLGNIPPPAERARASRVVVFVGGEDITTTTFDAPEKVSGYVLERIARYELAEKLADNPDDVHIVCFPAKKGAGRALVVSKKQLMLWLSELEKDGINPFAILPDYFSLPWEENSWTLCLDNERLIVRFGRFDGMAVELSLSTQILQYKLKNGAAPKACHVSFRRGQSDEIDENLNAVLSQMEEAGTIVVRAPRGKDMTIALKHGELAANLLRGAYNPFARIMNELANWRSVAALLVLTMLAYLTTVWLDTRKMEFASLELQQKNEDIYRKTIDADGLIVDIRHQTERALAARKTGSDNLKGRTGLIELLDTAGRSLMGSAWEIRSLSYNRNALVVELRANDFRALDQLKSGLEKKRLIIKTKRAVSIKDGVDAVLELTLTRGGNLDKAS